MDDLDTVSHHEDTSIVFGGERLADPDGEEGISTDDEINPTISQALHTGLYDALRLGYEGGNSSEHKAGTEALCASYEWTGIMGYASDGNPWLGRVPKLLLGELDAASDMEEVGASGLWVSAGFTGHGMPVAARCGMAVADMMLAKEGGIQVPTCWLASDERVSTARGKTIPRTLDEIVEDLRI